MSKLLISGKVVLFTEELAVLIGVTDAVILQKLEYWLRIHEKKGENFIDGRFWNYNSLPEWQKEMPYFSEKTIERAFKRLRDNGLVLVANYNEMRMDKTLWYSIDYEKLEKFMGASCQNDDMDTTPHTDKMSISQIDANITSK